MFGNIGNRRKNVSWSVASVACVSFFRNLMCGVLKIGQKVQVCLGVKNAVACCGNMQRLMTHTCREFI